MIGPPKAEVAGSNPAGFTIFNVFAQTGRLSYGTLAVIPPCLIKQIQVPWLTAAIGDIR